MFIIFHLFSGLWDAVHSVHIHIFCASFQLHFLLQNRRAAQGWNPFLLAQPIGYG
jgi:hypothetical protein